MNDVSTGGKGDQVSILLMQGSQLLFSSNWNGTQTVLQTLGGGNIQARNTVAAKATNPADALIVETETLTLKAFPNPSTQYFTVKLQSRVNEKAQLKVVDLLGRPVYLTEGSSNQTYRFGDPFASGSYFLQVTQGEKKQTLKLIKLK
ncbi:MAG: T9SS type A sorting domain-containing protein [Segetibacter sp.]